MLNSSSYKRPFDLTILVLAHLLLLPVWVLLWATIPLLIWLQDRGPVFYRQRRMGKGGRVFVVCKFRTMVLNADQLGPVWTVERDPRVTRIGRLLRRTALDELPQVLNIWKGEISLVGPRALDADEHRGLELEIPEFGERLRVRPGLTGLAQVYNRSDDARAKILFDLQYIRCMSPWLDLKLLFLSFINTLSARWDSRTGRSQQH